LILSQIWDDAETRDGTCAALPFPYLQYFVMSYI
jgi:hypothetical protein